MKNKVEMNNTISSKEFGYYPTHPGSVLKDELKHRKIRTEIFAKQIEIEHDVLKKILNEKFPITAEIAVLLEEMLGVSSFFWMRMQSRYDLQIAMKSKRLVKKVEKIRKEVKERELSNV